MTMQLDSMLLGSERYSTFGTISLASTMVFLRIIVAHKIGNFRKMQGVWVGELLTQFSIIPLRFFEIAVLSKMGIFGK